MIGAVLTPVVLPNRRGIDPGETERDTRGESAPFVPGAVHKHPIKEKYDDLMSNCLVSWLQEMSSVLYLPFERFHR